MARPRLRRGDLVTAVFAGDYGKPRPAVVVQTDRYGNLESILLCPLTSKLDTFGPSRAPAATASDNLRADSLIRVDKIAAVSLSRRHQRLGTLTPGELEQLDETLLLMSGLSG